MKRVLMMLLAAWLTCTAWGQTAQECFRKGVDYYKAKNYTKAVRWYRKAAERKDAGLWMDMADKQGITKARIILAAIKVFGFPWANPK